MHSRPWAKFSWYGPTKSWKQHYNSSSWEFMKNLQTLLKCANASGLDCKKLDQLAANQSIVLWTAKKKVLCICREWYEPHAVLVQEEGTVIGGLLVGLNVIDSNFDLKADKLDTWVSNYCTVCSDCNPWGYSDAYNYPLHTLACQWASLTLVALASDFKPSEMQIILINGVVS